MGNKFVIHGIYTSVNSRLDPNKRVFSVYVPEEVTQGEEVRAGFPIHSVMRAFRQGIGNHLDRICNFNYSIYLCGNGTRHYFQIVKYAMDTTYISAFTTNHNID